MSRPVLPQLRAISLSGWLWTLALLVGVVLRLLLTRGPLQVLDSDKAVVYLMARHVADGEIPTFFWGQSYGGSLLPVTAGAVFWVFGSSLRLLSLVESAYFLAAALLLRGLVTRLWGRSAGDVAASLFWLPGVTLLTLSFSDPGFYGPALVMGIGSLSLATSLALPDSLVRQAALGLCVGVAFWTSPVSLAFTVPALVIAGSRLRTVRGWLATSGVAALGGLPWLLANVGRGFPSLKSVPGSSSFPSRLVACVTDVLPAGVSLHLSSAGRIALAWGFLLLVAWGVGATIHARAWQRLSLIMSAPLAVLLLAVSGNPMIPAAFRYALYVAPAVAALVGAAVVRHRWVVLVTVGGLVLAVSAQGRQDSGGFAAVPYPGEPPGIEALARALHDRDIHAVYADFTISYVLAAATDEAITAASLAPRRYPGYEAAARSRLHPVVVMVSGTRNERALLARHLPMQEQFRVADYSVFIFQDRVDYFREGLPHHLQ